MIALPVFGYKSHISIDRRLRFIRAAAITSAAHPDGACCARSSTGRILAVRSGPIVPTAHRAMRPGSPIG